ncbi:MAG: PQQ-like beta-propeller repeat protein [Bacteroidaceae bacterium]|nr:PQQ-like beta-propeller repeat protein [Bacteroidaceae bacterium]
MKRSSISFFILSFFTFVSLQAQLVTFRSVNHCGIYSKEKNLLKEWPAEGPEKLWVVNDAGKGNSSALVSDGFIYTAGLTDDEQKEQLTCYKLDGTKVWQVTYGRAWTKSFQETRSTPVIDDDRLYMVSNMGELVCLNRSDGKILWTVDYWQKYSLSPNDQGICEHPLVDGNKVIVTTCGKEICMAAFDKLTGEVIWETKGFGDNATYCTSRIIEWKGHRQVVGGTELHIFGVDPETGKMLWNDSQWTPEQAVKKWQNAMINSPVFYKGKLLVSLGDGHGCTMYEMSDDLSSVKLLWKNKEIDYYMGGMIEIDGVVYGSTGDKHKWAALDIETGKVLYHEAWAGGKGRGALIMADGMFYMFDERRGTMGLARVNPEKLDVVSEFRVTDGSGACFSHPTIFDGILYIRHGSALIAYNIK